MDRPEDAQGGPLVILGAGGHGREVLDVARHDPTAPRVLGFLADEEPDPALLEPLGTSWLGPIAVLEGIDALFVIAVGDPGVRRTLHERATRWGREPARLWHRTAHRAAGVEVGAGTVVLANASVTSNVRLGLHVHVNLNATVAHDCDLGDYVTVNPGANLNGNVTVGPDATIGSGAVIRQGVTIGAGATVGAGAVVIRDVAPGTTVVGVPAQPI
ncbi:MAG TPA: NeuD/PglB/VioB family sugar acetyltransferase [Iamia sp.]|nr:NeuD/PglB/VioB family sugar acetyltransferase [Iamia sp.]